jgi:hypothetical protein
MLAALGSLTVSSTIAKSNCLQAGTSAPPQSRVGTSILTARTWKRLRRVRREPRHFAALAARELWIDDYGFDSRKGGLYAQAELITSIELALPLKTPKAFHCDTTDTCHKPFTNK